MEEADFTIESLRGPTDHRRFADEEFPGSEDRINPPAVRPDVKRCIFENVGTKFVNFREGAIQACRLRDCYFPNARFEHVNLTGTEFSNCNLKHATFNACSLEYVTFKGCELNYDSLIDNLPKKPNQAWALLRVLRLNAQAEGDVSRANALLLMELDASRRHEAAKFLHSGSYYIKNYQFSQRVEAFFAWLGHVIQSAVWGYGLRPYRLFRSGMVAVVGIALVDWLSKAQFYVPQAQFARRLGFWESFYVSVVTFTTLGYGDFAPADVLARTLHGFEAVFGALFLGLLAATAFRRVAR